MFQLTRRPRGALAALAATALLVSPSFTAPSAATQAPTQPTTIAAKGATKPYTLTFSGLQSARTGMTMDRAARSLGWRLRLDRSAGETAPCYNVPVGPPAAGVWVLTTQGRKGGIERFSVLTQMGIRVDPRQTPRTAAGIGIGSTRAQVFKAYRGVKQSQHEYVRGGHYLDVFGPRRTGIRFETNERGRVTAMHSGKVPQILYVEGCL